MSLVNSAGVALGAIGAQFQTIRGLMEQIANSSMEQASGISEINQAVTSMDRITQQNAAMAEESSAAVQRLAMEADELARLIANFKVSKMASPQINGGRSGQHLAYVANG